MTLLILGIGSSCLMLGITLLVFCWRGRRLDDHPHCRRCRYDLSGHDDLRTCPECGRDLTKRRALRHGTRRRRRWALVLGCGLLLLGVCGGGLVGWQRATGYNCNTIKPVLWLHADAKRTSSPAVAEAALMELIDRFARGELSRRQVRRLADTALVMQQDERVTWPSLWGVIVEKGISQGLVTADQRDAYLRAATTTRSGSLTTRSKVRQGARVPVRITFGTERVGVFLPNHMRRWMRHNECLGYRIDGEVVPLDKAGEMTHHMRGDSVEAYGDWAIEFDGEAGAHTLEIDVHCYAGEYEADEGRMSFEEESRERWFGPWPMTLTATFEVVPSDETVVQRVSAAQAGPPPLAHVRTQTGQFEMNAGGSNYVVVLETGAVWIEEYPLGVSFDVVAREGEREQIVGKLAAPPGGFTLGRFDRPLAEIFPEAAIVDIILRTNIKHAEEEVDIDSIWDGEIVIKNVPIREPVGDAASEGDAAG